MWKYILVHQRLLLHIKQRLLITRNEAFSLNVGLRNCKILNFWLRYFSQCFIGLLFLITLFFNKMKFKVMHNDVHNDGQKIVLRKIQTHILNLS